jgi:class 3 adenylate cyclase
VGTASTQPALLVGKFSLKGGLAFLAVALFVNSLLALLGTLLWGFFPYWPAFTIATLVALHWRPWGIALAILSPIATSLLFHDAPLGVYIPVDLLQVSLFLFAMHALKIDSRLTALRDKSLFIVAAIAAPSAMGATLAWLLHTLLHRPIEPYLIHTSKWVVENTIPALFPGIWLYQIVGDRYGPDGWERTRSKVSWMQRTGEYLAPWILTVLVVAATLVAVVLQQVGTDKIGAVSAPDYWDRLMVVARDVPSLRWAALALSITILYSLGSAVRHAKESWALMDTIRRHLPNKRVSEMLTRGGPLPTEQRTVTVMFTDIRGFTEISEKFAPADLVVWLNAYFSRMVSICHKYNGSVDKFIGDGLMVVFGLQSEDSGAKEAILCALDMIADVESNLATSGGSTPAIHIGAGLMTGLVTAGELGSPDRKQYTVIGSTVNAAARLEGASKGTPNDCLPLVLSESTARHAGLLVREDLNDLLGRFEVSLKGVSEIRDAYAVKRSRAKHLQDLLTQAKRIGDDSIQS